MACDGLAMACGVVLAATLLKRAGFPLAEVYAALWWIIVVIVIRSDIERFIIPDGASLAIAALGLTYILAETHSTNPSAGDAVRALAAALFKGGGAFCLFWMVGRIYRHASGRHGLGFGDVKLAGASALWLDPADSAVALEIAALAALSILLVRRRREHVRDVAVPFGAFLAPAAWLAFVTGPTIHAFVDGLP